MLRTNTFPLQNRKPLGKRHAGQRHYTATGRNQPHQFQGPQSIFRGIDRDAEVSEPWFLFQLPDHLRKSLFTHVQAGFPVQHEPPQLFHAESVQRGVDFLDDRTYTGRAHHLSETSAKHCFALAIGLGRVKIPDTPFPGPSYDLQGFFRTGPPGPVRNAVIEPQLSGSQHQSRCGLPPMVQHPGMNPIMFLFFHASQSQALQSVPSSPRS